MRLTQATPQERGALVLQQLAAHPHEPLALSVLDGHVPRLDEVDLSPAALQLYGAQAGSISSAERGGVNLRGARLRGASLRLARLAGADLREADLREASLGGIQLQGATLERAQLAGADLADAQLQDVALGEANLQRAMLEEANLQRAGLRFAQLAGAVLEGADLQGADLWGANLAGADLERANLRGAQLHEADLTGANLAGADLEGAELEGAQLAYASLRGANLQRAILSATNFQGALLSGARLQELELSNCTISNVHLSGVRFDETRLQLEQLGGAIGEELARDYRAARLGYLALERNFLDLGDPDAASWAYRRKRRMQKLEALSEARQARARGQWSRALRRYLGFSLNQLVEWLCDYGESVPRVLTTILVVYLIFGLLYGLTDSVMSVVVTPDGPVSSVTRNPLDVAVFALIAMTTPEGPSVGLAMRSQWVHILTTLQALLTIALTGLLGFVMGNRIRR